MIKYPFPRDNLERQFQIGELSRITKVKAGTIRFYESCGFLEPADNWDLEAYDQAAKRYLQAAQLIGVTPEAVRNWESNGLLGRTQSDRRRAC